MPSLAWQVRAQGGYSTRAAGELVIPPAGPCSADGCDREDTRLYGTGARCPLHTPAAVAGRPEPPTGDPFVARGPVIPPRHYARDLSTPACEGCGNRLPAALVGHMTTHPACDPSMHALRAIARRSGRR